MNNRDWVIGKSLNPELTNVWAVLFHRKCRKGFPIERPLMDIEDILMKIAIHEAECDK